jgi:hypothetical protein
MVREAAYPGQELHFISTESDPETIEPFWTARR